MNKSPYACVATENPAILATRKLKRAKESRAILRECRDAILKIFQRYRKTKIAIHPTAKRPGTPNSSVILPRPPSAAPDMAPPPPKCWVPCVPTPALRQIVQNPHMPTLQVL